MSQHFRSGAQASLDGFIATLDGLDKVAELEEEEGTEAVGQVEDTAREEDGRVDASFAESQTARLALRGSGYMQEP